MNTVKAQAQELASPDADAVISGLGQAARRAASSLATSAAESRNTALKQIAAQVRARAGMILEANAGDVDRGRESGLDAALIDRLMLNPGRIEAIAGSLDQIAGLPDPVGREIESWERPNGLKIRRVAVAIGVIAVIYESRPNVTADAAALCMKAGNAVILRGGSEAAASNRAIFDAIHAGLEQAGLDPDTVQMVPSQDRALVGGLLRAHGLVDVVVPRGGRSLVERVQRDARVPVFAHLDGNNHLYWHASAEPQCALEVIVNAKMRRPGICGALETLLIDAGCLDRLPALVQRLTELGCELRGDARARSKDERIRPATEADWDTEYLDAILAIRTVDTPAEAMAHIERHGSSHTDGILAEDPEVAETFLATVDSAIVVHNASTQFADGGEFGFGAEIGIATGRLHARGPVGLEQLTTFKYQLRGSGQTRP